MVTKIEPLSFGWIAVAGGFCKCFEQLFKCSRTCVAAEGKCYVLVLNGLKYVVSVVMYFDNFFTR